MGKVLLYVAIVVTVVAAALGFINGGTLGDSRSQLADTRKKFEDTSAQLNQSKSKLKDAEGKLETAEKERDDAAKKAETAESDTKKAQAQVAGLTSQVSAKENEVEGLKKEVADAKASSKAAPVAPGPSQNEVDELKLLNQKLQDEKVKLQADRDSAQARAEELKSKQDARAAGLMRKGLEGRILAVNQAWNFVVLDLGDRNGVVGNAEMLIKRGNQLIGKVRITSVEPSTSIADIIPTSVQRGVTIQPGDHVIYQSSAD